MRARVYIHGRMLAGPHKGKMLGQYWDDCGQIDFTPKQALAIARGLCRNVDGVVRVMREDLSRLVAYRWDGKKAREVSGDPIPPESLVPVASPPAPAAPHPRLFDPELESYVAALVQNLRDFGSPTAVLSISRYQATQAFGSLETLGQMLPDDLVMDTTSTPGRVVIRLRKGVAR